MFDKIITRYSSYLWFLRRQIGEIATILDLGCGNGQFMKALSEGKDWKITGVDMDKNYLNKARKRNIYSLLIHSDVNFALNQLTKKGAKFDIVFSSQLIEHLPEKEGLRMLQQAEKVATRKIIISSPRGFMQQPDFYSDGNPLQYHRSEWSEDKLLNLGYKVYGIGFKPIWSGSGIALTKNKFVFWLSSLLAYIFSPIVFLVPSLGAGIIGIKKL